MKTLRPLALLLAFAASAGGLAAQRTPAPPAEEPSAAVAEEVYVPEKTPSPAAAPASAGALKPEASAASAAAPNDPKTTASAPPAAAKSAAAATAAAPTLSPRFVQVRERIDALFSHRSEAPPTPDPRKNPFRPAGAAPVTGPAPRRPGVPADAPPAAVSTTDLALLQQAAAPLKVFGTIQIGGVAHLIINQVPYKEGDVISTKVKGQPVFVRVKHISRYSYTLSLNTTELSVKY